MITIPPTDLATASPSKMARIKSLLGITAVVNALTGKRNIDVVRSADFTAVIGDSYVTVANLIVTDPVGASAGSNFCVQVEAGTASVGGTTYAVGTFVRRVYYAGNWFNRVYYAIENLNKQQRAELMGFLAYADTLTANAAIGVIGIPFFNIANDAYETTTDTV